MAIIDGIFNQSAYVAAKTMLDATALRHQAIASNLANVETPGYKRLDLSPDFQKELNTALTTRSGASLAQLRPSIQTDPNAVSVGPDGNNVQLESELLELNQNGLAHAIETQLISGNLLKLRLAITGRAG